MADLAKCHFRGPPVEIFGTTIPIADAVVKAVYNDGIIREVQQARLFRQFPGRLLAGGDFRLQPRGEDVRSFDQPMLAKRAQQQRFIQGDSRHR